MEIVRVPLVSANEREIEVHDVLVREGARIAAGDLLCVFETTKATLELEAPVGGFVRELRLVAGASATVGDILCVLTETADEPVELAEERSVGRGLSGSIEATRKARELAERHGIDLADLATDGIVTAKEVENALAARRHADRGPEEPTVSAEQIAILGAGGHARVIVDLIRAGRPDLEITGAYDDNPKAPSDVLGVPVLGSSEGLEEARSRGVAAAALGVGAVKNNARRIELFERLRGLGFHVPSLVHPRAVLERSVRMGRGNQIFAGAVIGSNVSLGDNTIVNSGSVLSHDCVIGSHSHVTPGAILAGGVRVGRNTVIGMGVTVYLGVTIGDDVVIANGSHITANIPDGSVIGVKSSQNVS